MHVKEFRSKKVINNTELCVKVDLYQKFLKKGYNVFFALKPTGIYPNKLKP